MCAGYSGRPVAEKLGFKPGLVVALVHPPGDYRRLVGPMPENVALRRRASGVVDIVHAFVKKRSVLEADFERWKGAIRANGCLWVSWPKKASGVSTDLTGDVVREIALARGLVDVKVTAIDDTWSGMKLVFRLRDRALHRLAAKEKAVPGTAALRRAGLGARQDGVSPSQGADRSRRDLQDAPTGRSRRWSV